MKLRVVGILVIIFLLAGCSNLNTGDIERKDAYDARENYDARLFCASELAKGIVAVTALRNDLRLLVDEQDELNAEEIEERLSDALDEVTSNTMRGYFNYNRYAVTAGWPLIGPAHRHFPFDGSYTDPCRDDYVASASDVFYHVMGTLESAHFVAEQGNSDAVIKLVERAIDDDAFLEYNLRESVYMLISSPFFSSQVLDPWLVLIKPEDEWLQSLIDERRRLVDERNAAREEEGLPLSDWDAWYEE